MSDIKFKRSNSTPNSHVSVDSSSVAFKTLAAPESPEEHGLLGCTPQNFRFRRSGIQLETKHFSQVPRWCGWCLLGPQEEKLCTEWEHVESLACLLLFLLLSFISLFNVLFCYICLKTLN